MMNLIPSPTFVNPCVNGSVFFSHLSNFTSKSPRSAVRSRVFIPNTLRTALMALIENFKDPPRHWRMISNKAKRPANVLVSLSPLSSVNFKNFEVIRCMFAMMLYNVIAEIGSNTSCQALCISVKRLINALPILATDP